MLDESVKLLDELPISICYASVDEYPIHRHRELEIIYILEGTVDVKVCNGIYELHPGNIHIVKENDLHSIYKKNDSNLVLIFQIRFDYFLEYFPDLYSIIFVCDKKDHKPEVEIVKQLLIKIMIYT